MKRLAMVAAVVFLLGATAAPAFGQATRTWISGTGNDVDPCSFTAPCRTFAGAITKTFIGGEINVVSDGGFGAVTITKSITIDGAGHNASILASGTNGVIIRIPENANDPHRRVVLRNLSINGTGATGTVGTNTGLHGVSILNEGATRVELENVRIANFSQGGIRVATNATSPADMSVSLDNVFVSDLTGNGLDLRPPAGHRVNALVENSTFKHIRPVAAAPAGESGVGIAADTGAQVWLTGTSVFDTQIGLGTFARLGAPGAIHSFCDNQIAGNISDGVAPNELCPKPVQQAPPDSVPAAKQCVVPNLRGLPVSFAKRLLGAANCSIGRVAKKKTPKRSRRGKVMSQRIRAGTTLDEDARVGVTVGRR